MCGVELLRLELVESDSGADSAQFGDLRAAQSIETVNQKSRF